MFKIDIKIAPSVLACDLSALADESIKVYEAGAHMLHLDVMDGHFVPNITFGAPVIKTLRKKLPILFDVHLMISKPYDYIKDFADAGADMITFHLEAESPVEETISLIKSFGKKAGISIKPNTPAKEVFKYLPHIDMVLVMSVEPGFGGQSFIEGSIDKIREIRKEAARLGLDTDIQVDGGIDDKTVRLVSEAGANVFVAGSYIFKDDYKKAIGLLIKNAEEAKSL